MTSLHRLDAASRHAEPNPKSLLPQALQRSCSCSGGANQHIPGLAQSLLLSLVLRRPQVIYPVQAGSLMMMTTASDISLPSAACAESKHSLNRPMLRLASR